MKKVTLISQITFNKFIKRFDITKIFLKEKEIYFKPTNGLTFLNFEVYNAAYLPKLPFKL